MKKGAIYCRVSTALQEQEKTIESQVAELEEICKKQDVQIIKKYLDDGFSGANLDRPALDQLRTDASKGIFERIYFHSNDRLSRNLTNQGIIVEELEKKEIEVFFYDKPIADTPEGKFLFQILGAAAEFEKAKILERTRRGKLYKAKRGIVVGGIPPFGNNYIKKTKEREGYYETNEEEANTVILIADLYLKVGSVRAVARELTKRDIKPRKGGQWRTSTLHGILRNETNIGTTYFNKRYAIETNNGKQKYKKRIKTGTKLREKKEWIPIPVTPIMPKEKFYAIQALLVKNHKVFNNGKHSYLLSGLVKCGICDSTYSGELSHGHPFYRCNNRHRTFPLPKECNAKMVSADKLDTAIWNTVSEAIKNPRILTDYILQTTKEIQEDEETINKEKEQLFKKREDLRHKKNRMLEIYSDAIITKEELSEKMEDYAKQDKELSQKIEEIDTKLGQEINRPLMIQDIEYFCQVATTKIENLSLEEKHWLLMCLVEKIVFDSIKGEAKVMGRIPLAKEGQPNLTEILNSQCGAMSIAP